MLYQAGLQNTGERECVRDLLKTCVSRGVTNSARLTLFQRCTHSRLYAALVEGNASVYSAQGWLVASLPAPALY